jgi:hypothetical protein
MAHGRSAGNHSVRRLMGTLEEIRSGIFLRSRYIRVMRHLVDIGIHAEKEVIQ